MRVFLSWSGEVSHKVACILKDWLPSVIQSIRPYVSSEDIDKGARWSTDIAKELHESTFGILCVTKANIDAPWINFEAGALSKTIDKGSVAPFLFDVKRSEVQGPLLQFQSTINEKVDMHKLIVSLNNAMSDAERLEESALSKSFNVWWPELEKGLARIAPSEEKPKAHERTGKLAASEAILEELLELVRSQQRLLRSPDELLPRTYLEQILRHNNVDLARAEEALFVMNKARKELAICVERLEKLKDVEPLVSASEVQVLLHDLASRLKKEEFRMHELMRFRVHPHASTRLRAALSATKDADIALT